MIGSPHSGYVSPEELNLDHSYQRPLEPTRLGPGGDLYPFDPCSIGSTSVSMRSDGTKWCLDGQHRMEAARRAGHSRTKFPAQVYEGLTVAEEAQLFILLNRYRAMSTVNKFRARVRGEEDAANIIDRLVAKHGWSIGAGAQKGRIAAVAALETVYKGARIRREGGQEESLDRTIEILTGAFGYSSEGVNSSLIKGVGLVILRHGDSVDTAKLIGEMGSIEGGPGGLLGRAKALKSIRGGDLPNSVAEIVVELHNNRRRPNGPNTLPQWRRS